VKDQAPTHVLVESCRSPTEQPSEHVRITGDAVAAVVVEEPEHGVMAVVVLFDGMIPGVGGPGSSTCFTVISCSASSAMIRASSWALRKSRPQSS